MHARGWIFARIVQWTLGVAIATAGVAAAEPAPKPVDIKPLKAKATVLQDGQGGTYVVFRTDDGRRLFYGPTAKALYEQYVPGSGSNGEAYDLSVWAPRLAEARYASFSYKDDKTYVKSCGGKDDAVLSELTGDKARAILDKSEFLTTGLVHVAHLLARDDSGVYYYVDRINKLYGGKGYRVFVGKKGAMKQMPLTDVASDSAGEVFSTKSGDLRLVRHNEGNKDTMTWVKGEKRLDLVFLDPDVNSVVIYKDLGIYTFLGTLCDNV